MKALYIVPVVAAMFITRARDAYAESVYVDCAADAQLDWTDASYCGRTEASAPTPPWEKWVTVLRSSFSENSAKLLTQSEIESELRRLQTSCLNQGGIFSHQSYATLCTQAGSGPMVQYNCRGRAFARCSA